jgi:hypothetical protein
MTLSAKKGPPLDKTAPCALSAKPLTGAETNNPDRCCRRDTGQAMIRLSGCPADQAETAMSLSLSALS